ncbi:MAG: M48 family metalloprotease [Pleurocapsa sp. MO_192.B19]|nr:M48 family metalloprotease [Pleurocapsa sp. MO_192.B19]
MNFIKQLNTNKLLVIIVSFILAITSNNLVYSKTLDTPKISPQLIKNNAIFTISQISDNIKFSSNYYDKLLEADRFYKQGDLQTAKQIQKQVKPDFPVADSPPAAEADLSKLDAKAKQYWTTAIEAIEEDPTAEEAITSRIFEPLKSLVKEYPGFIPGHILLADTYDLYSEEDNALRVIEKASEMYPGRDDVLDNKIDLLLTYGKYLEASIAAREFAYSYPNYHKTPAYEQAADKYFQQYQKKLKSKITTSGILGSIGQVATGNESSALEISQMLLTGENTAGQAFAASIKAQSKMVSNSRQLEYINDIGQRLAKLMGRDEFTYEFNIIDDPSPNAFALPGGKIFFHTGMLQLMDSEAELAGVLAHEIAHSVLSHSYKRIGESALTNTASNLLSSVVGREVGAVAKVGELLLSQKFSRGKEKQADVLGLRVLDAAGYSADGLYNVMAKLKQLSGKSNFAESLLSSHPASSERMRYLEELIQNKGYNRYGYEGVEAYRAVFPR